MTDSEWFALKATTDQQPSNVMEVVKNFEINDRDKVKTNYSGKFMRTQVKITDNLILYVYQDKNGFLEKAFYTCFNDKKSVCYKRDIT